MKYREYGNLVVNSRRRRLERASFGGDEGRRREGKGRRWEGGEEDGWVVSIRGCVYWYGLYGLYVGLYFGMYLCIYTLEGCRVHLRVNLCVDEGKVGGGRKARNGPERQAVSGGLW